MVKIVGVCPFDDIEVFGCHGVFMVINIVERDMCFQVVDGTFPEGVHVEVVWGGVIYVYFFVPLELVEVLRVLLLLVC